MTVRTPWDPGLQPERTSLAWRRFTLAAAVVGLLVVKVGLGDDRARLAAAGVVLAGLALAIGVAAHRRSGAVAQPLAGRDPLPGGGVLALAAGYTAALGLVALGLTLVSAFAG